MYRPKRAIRLRRTHDATPPGTRLLCQYVLLMRILKVNCAKFVNFLSSPTNFQQLLSSRAATDALDKRNGNQVLRHLRGHRLVAIAGHLKVNLPADLKEKASRLSVTIRRA